MTGPATNFVPTIYPTFLIVGFRTFVGIMLLFLRLTFITSKFFRNNVFPYRIGAKWRTVAVFINIDLASFFYDPTSFCVCRILAFCRRNRTTINHFGRNLHFYTLMASFTFRNESLAVMTGIDRHILTITLTVSNSLSLFFDSSFSLVISIILTHGRCERSTNNILFGYSNLRPYLTFITIVFGKFFTVFTSPRAMSVPVGYGLALLLDGSLSERVSRLLAFV